ASRMSKIRINDLARELEVKPSVILDMLPELGVMDKKTHSSSLDDDIVLQLRERVAAGLTGESSGEGSERVSRAQEPSEHYEQPGRSVEAPAAAPGPETARVPVPASARGGVPSAGDERMKESASAPELVPPVRSAFPLRPPLATGQRVVQPVVHPVGQPLGQPIGQPSPPSNLQ